MVMPELPPPPEEPLPEELLAPLEEPLLEPCPPVMHEQSLPRQFSRLLRSDVPCGCAAAQLPMQL